MKLTKFESDLVRLNWVGTRFENMFIEYQNTKPHKQFAYSFASILREYAIIQLANFIDARDSLMHSLKKQQKMDIDKILHRQWKPIYNHKKAIFKIRSSYIAHIQKGENPFDITLEEISEKFQFPNVKGDLLYLIAMAIQYNDFMQMYFKVDYEKARKKLVALKPHKTIIGILSDKKARQNADQSYVDTKSDLELNGLI